jgi:hypothetical protein
MDIESKPVAEDVAVVVEKTPRLPKKIRLTRIWGFIGNDGVDRLWQPGQTVDDPSEIKMIVHDCKFEHYEVVK